MSDEKITLTEEQRETYARNLKFQSEATQDFKELIENLPECPPSRRSEEEIEPTAALIASGISYSLGARIAQFTASEAHRASMEDLIGIMFVDGIMASLNAKPAQENDFWEIFAGYIVSSDIQGKKVTKPFRVFAESLLEAVKMAEDAEANSKK